MSLLAQLREKDSVALQLCHATFRSEPARKGNCVTSRLERFYDELKRFSIFCARSVCFRRVQRHLKFKEVLSLKFK